MNIFKRKLHQQIHPNSPYCAIFSRFSQGNMSPKHRASTATLSLLSCKHFFRQNYIKIYTKTHQIVPFSKTFLRPIFPNPHRNRCTIKFSQPKKCPPSFECLYTGSIRRRAHFIGMFVLTTR